MLFLHITVLERLYRFYPLKVKCKSGRTAISALVDFFENTLLRGWEGF
jgi:hypothetical protein